jgi:plastocyanin
MGRAGALAAIGALALAGCGSSSSGGSGSTGTTGNNAKGSVVTITADPAGKPAFVSKTLTTKTGKVTINFINKSQSTHNVNIASNGTMLAKTPSFKNGAASLSLILKPGTYTFYSSIPGQQKAGMAGTLTVSS